MVVVDETGVLEGVTLEEGVLVGLLLSALFASLLSSGVGLLAGGELELGLGLQVSRFFFFFAIPWWLGRCLAWWFA